MAKFCGNCGTPMEDNAKVCGNCGTPLEGGSSSIVKLKIEDPQKKEKFKKKIKTIFVISVLLVVGVVGINVITNFTGSKGLVHKIMAAYEKYDIDALIMLSSDIYYYDSEDYVEQYFENSIGTDLDSFEMSVGHSYKLSYEVNEIYELSERKLKDTMENIEYKYPDFDPEFIEKVVVADITVTAKQGSKTMNQKVKITMSKEDDTWRLLYIE